MKSTAVALAILDKMRRQRMRVHRKKCTFVAKATYCIRDFWERDANEEFTDELWIWHFSLTLATFNHLCDCDGASCCTKVLMSSGGGAYTEASGDWSNWSRACVCQVLCCVSVKKKLSIAILWYVSILKCLQYLLKRSETLFCNVFVKIHVFPYFYCAIGNPANCWKIFNCL